MDDEPGLADLTAEMLEREADRLTVETATSASEGLDRLTETDSDGTGDPTPAFDCVVSDHEMPGMDGIEFLQAVRERYPDLPFVLFTGKGSEAIASDAISAGVTDYLQKGSGTEQYELLANRITNAVAAYSAQRRANETEQRRAALIEHLGEPAVEVRFDGDTPVVTTANDAFADTFGVEASTALDAPLAAHVRVHGQASDGATDGRQADDGGASRGTDQATDAVAGRATVADPDEDAAGDRGTTVDSEPDRVADDVAPGDTDGESDQDHVTDTTDGARAAPGATPSSLDSLVEPDERVERELRCETAAGPRWFLLRTAPFSVAETAYAYAVFVDITERKHQRERFQAFLDNSTDIITVLAPDGTYLYQSPSSERILGYEPADLLGESAFQYVHPDDHERVAAAFEAAIDDEELVPTVTYRFRHRDGSWRWLESTGNNQLSNPAIEGFVVNSRDVTERKRKEQELERVNERMTFALRTTDAVVWDWDVENDRATFYPSEKELYGTTIETREDFLSVVHPEDRQEVRESLERSLETGEPKQEEIRILDDGDVRWLETSGKPIQNDGTTRLVGLARDVTERKRNEEEIYRQNERLERFASVVSHDLRNPLNVAQGRVELARTQAESDEAVDPDHLADAARAHERMERLIEDLLVLAREGNRVTEPESVDLDDLVASHRTALEGTDATLDVQTDQTIRADPGRMDQLVENLFRNAVEHGGEDVTVTVGDLESGFYVADDGPGIPADEREAVFDTGYSTNPEGTGFGLNIVREIVQAHDWSIRATESASGGARFEIRFRPE